jgi:hypothetical protein
MRYPLLSVFWTMLEFFVFIVWLFLLFKIIGDIFRTHDSSGWTKAAWLILVIILPFLGVFLYVIIHGKDMSERDLARAQQQDKEFQASVRQAAGPSGSNVDELSKLADLKEKGAITDPEFQQAKAKILA